MIIKPVCTQCGKVITVDVMLIDRQQKTIEKLEEQVRSLQAKVIGLQGQERPEDFFRNIFGGT